MIELKVDPVAKPRMTRSDTWKHRKIVNRYFAFKDAMVSLCNINGFELPDSYRVEFFIKMPDSWSIKKKKEFDGRPHKQKPDLDNLVKSVNDCLKKEDSTVYYIEASKIWWKEGKIVIYPLK